MTDIDLVLKAIKTKLDREINLFNYKFEAILETVAKELDVSTINSLTDSLNFDYEFNRILTEAGYYDLVSEFIDTSYDTTYVEIQSLFKASGLSLVYTKADIDAMGIVKGLDMEFFTQIGNEASNILKRDLYKYTLSDLPATEIVSNIRQSLEGTSLAKYSKTYAETAISNYNQSLLDLKSKDAQGEVYIYRGVDDSKNRAFCQCLLDQHKHYNRSDGQSIKNDNRRQYNCRHLVVPVSKEWAEENGYTAGSFTC